MRVGFGYDIHRLVAGRPLFLGLIEIPFERGLLGHSDGDAVAHAVADAMLSASGLADLGHHFPDTDPAWKGASGLVILTESKKLAAARGFRPAQVDVTIVAEAPKLAPHRDAMRRALAEALNLSADEVGVKARTNEGLDAVGRGEAIAVYAVALLSPS